MLDQKQEERREHEQHDRVARQPVGESLPARRLQVFLHRHRPDVAHAPPVQIAGRRVVEGVFPAPMIVGRERQHAGDEPQDVVGFPRLEKRAVPAVVEE